MNLSRAMLGLALGVLLLGVGSPATAADKGKRAQERFFSTLGEHRAIDVDALRAQLLKVARECTRTEKPCPASDDLLAMVAGDLYVRRIPIHVVYIDANLDVQVNKLFWFGKLTPFVEASQSLGLIVFSDAPLDLEAKLIDLYTQRGGFVSLFVSEGRRTIDAREASQNVKKLDLERLESRQGESVMWGDSVQFYLDPTTSYRLSVIPVEESIGDAPRFKEIQAQFSNSNGRSVDFGLGIGATFGVDADEIEGVDGVLLGDSTHVNAYWLITAYLKKPVLLKPIAGKGQRYRVSYGITFGVNVAFWDADEFSIGFNLGHLYGRHGIVVGVNWISPDDLDSTANPFFAFDFKF